MHKDIIDIKGMHCRSCEMLVEDELLKIPGVSKVVVNQKKGTAEIYHKEKLNLQRLEQAVSSAGYCLGKDEKPWLSKNPKDYRDLGFSALIILILFVAARFFGIFDLSLVKSNNYSSLPIVFLIGITAGLSTCMAMVGGLVLGASARYAEKHPTASSIEKFKPHLFFNAGRVLSFFVLGGLIGFVGSFFQLSTTLLGLLTIVVGGVMLLLGLQLTEISPAVRTISLPKLKILGNREQNPAVLGALTFFLPCGFTQAMQLFAISSGNVVTGALTMGVFAIGTTPGLLGIGGIMSVVKGTFGGLFFKTAGLVVLILAIFNISNGYNLTGFNPGEILSTMFSVRTSTTAPSVEIQNGVQIVNMTQDSLGYNPNSFNIKKGIPVRWVINSTNAFTCAASIIMQKYNIRRSLKAGENIIEFTPTESGTVPFTCSMGMYRGVFNVN